jgi:hypothetical protein
VFRIVVFGTLPWAGYRTDVVASRRYRRSAS